MAVSLDTLQIAKRLRQAGFTEPQAESVTAVLRESREFDLAELATKADLALVRADLDLVRADLDHLRSDMENGFATARSDAENGFAAVRSEIAAIRSDTEREFAAVQSDTEREFAAVRSEFAAVRSELAMLRREIEARIDTRVDALRSELIARIEAAKSDTIKWVIGIAFAQAATILAVLRFFPGPHG